MVDVLANLEGCSSRYRSNSCNLTFHNELKFCAHFESLSSLKGTYHNARSQPAEVELAVARMLRLLSLFPLHFSSYFKACERAADRSHSAPISFPFCRVSPLPCSGNRGKRNRSSHSGHFCSPVDVQLISWRRNEMQLAVEWIVHGKRHLTACQHFSFRECGL